MKSFFNDSIHHLSVLIVFKFLAASRSKKKPVYSFLHNFLSPWNPFFLDLTQQMRNSTLTYPVKREYGCPTGIFLKTLCAERRSFFYWICNLEVSSFLWIKCIGTKWLSQEGILKIFFLYHFSPSFLGQKWYNFTHIPFWPDKVRLNFSSTVCPPS